jgi:hypothetical protein
MMMGTRMVPTATAKTHGFRTLSWARIVCSPAMDPAVAYWPIVPGVGASRPSAIYDGPI